MKLTICMHIHRVALKEKKNQKSRPLICIKKNKCDVKKSQKGQNTKICKEVDSTSKIKSKEQL